MASVPRQGRKGGKVDVNASTPPSMVTGSSAVNADAAADKPVSATTTATSSSGFEGSNFLQFDASAVDAVGKGVVLGGSKAVRTESRPTNVDKADVRRKLDAFFAQQGAQVSTEAREACRAVERPTLALLQSTDVLATTYSEGVTLLVSTILSDSKAVGLVIVPSYFVVEKTVSTLRKYFTASPSLVGEWVGSSVVADPSTRLWVCDAKTALSLFVQLHSKAAEGDHSPLTHVVFLKIRSHQPVAQSAFAALKQFTGYRGKILIAGGSLAEDMEKLQAYVAPRSAKGSVAVAEKAPFDVDALTIEDVCALTEMSVVTVAVDRTGKFPGPHPKVVEHALEVCLALLDEILKHAKSPQTIVIFTADVGDTIAQVQKSKASEFLVQRDELMWATDGAPSSPLAASRDGNHRIHVFHHCDLDEGLDLHATVVIDKGTMKMSWVPTPAEGAFPCKRTEWQSKQEQSFRKRMLGWQERGLYVALYPVEAEEVFPAQTAPHLELIDMEGALLQCSRVGAAVTPEKLLNSFPKESILRAMIELGESGAIVASDNLGFTFSGEVLSRLPTLTDASMLILSGLVLGLEEAAIACAAVATIHLFAHKTDAAMASSEWLDLVARLRQQHAGEKCKRSDVLADAMIALKWIRASLSSSETAQAMADALQIPTYRLHSISTLMSHLREQLTDYAWVEPFSSIAAVDRAIESLDTHWDVLSLMLASAFCRKAVVVRNDGQLNARDIGGNMMFLRTVKTAAPNTYFPSGVSWHVGNTVVATTIMNSSHNLYLKDMTTLRSTFFLTAVVLLAPGIEYSAPQTVDGRTVVYFTLAANGQQKRVKIDLDGAARILEFREKWNKAFGGLQVFRSLPRATTLSQFAAFLQVKDKAFNLKALQRELQEELKNIVEEAVVVEDNRSFPQMNIQRVAPDTSMCEPITKIAPSSDEIAMEAFRTGTLAAKYSGLARESSTIHAADTTHEDVMPLVSGSKSGIEGPTRPPVIIEDDDVETEHSFFSKHGPIVEDDD